MKCSSFADAVRLVADLSCAPEAVVAAIEAYQLGLLNSAEFSRQCVFAMTKAPPLPPSDIRARMQAIFPGETLSRMLGTHKRRFRA